MAEEKAFEDEVRNQDPILDPIPEPPLVRQRQVVAPPPPAAAPGQKIEATTTYKTVLEGSQFQQGRPYRPPMPMQGRFSVPDGRDRNAKQWLDNNFDNTQYADHYITVKRKTPVQFAGTVIGADKHLPLMSLGELVQSVQDLAGGGNYRYDICTPDHAIHLSGNFTVPINEYPPKSPDGISSVKGVSPDSPEVAKKKEELEVLKLEKQMKRLQTEDAEVENKRKELEMGEAAEARKEMLQFFRESREETRRLMEESKKDNQQMMTNMMTMMKEIVSSKRDDNGSSSVIAESMKAQSDFLAKSIASQAESQKSFMMMAIEQMKSSKEDVVSNAKLAAEQNAKVMELVVNTTKTMAEANRGSGDKMQELLVSILTKQANQQPMKEVLDLMQRGEDRAAEKYEMILEFMDRNKPSNLDPNASPVDNLLTALIDRFAGGKSGAPALSPARPLSNPSPNDLGEFARQLAPMVAAHIGSGPAALPPPQNDGMPAAPAQQPPPITSHDLFSDGDDDDDTPTMGVPSSPPAAQQATQQPNPQAQPRPVPKTKEEAIQMAGGEENYSKAICTQVILLAASDARSKAMTATWVQPALMWLSDPVQKAIADAVDVPHKALILQQRCDPPAFDQLKAVTTPETYKVFTDGLVALSEAIKSRTA